MSDEVVLDTTINEVFDGTEVESLVFGLERSRAQFAWKVGGLDADALNRPFPSSTMTLAGLIKHLTRVELQRTSLDLTGEPMPEPWASKDWDIEYGWDWTSAHEDSPAELYRGWQDAVAASRAAMAKLFADGGADQPTRRTMPPGWSMNLRRVLVDMHDEYARHVGHADLLREPIDGLVGEDPPRAGE